MARRSDLSSLVRQSALERQREAVRLECDYIGAEHHFIGLLRVKEGNAFKILTRLGYTAEELVAAAEELAHPADDPPASAHGLPVTVELQHAYRKMNEAAARLGSETVGTEHLLLGLLSRPQGGNPGPLVKAMAEQGLTFEKVEKAVQGSEENEE